MIYDLILKNRSYRRFDSTVDLPADVIAKWINLARISGSGRNAQPLKYVVANGKEICSKIFPHLGWAGYLSKWKGPEEGERPVAYIAVVKDKTISENHYCDDGIAMQSILLGAAEDGFGGCMIGSVNKNQVAKILQLPETMELLWIIALGKPAEECRLVEEENGDIKYWRGEDDVHYVPKRSLNDIILKNIEK